MKAAQRAERNARIYFARLRGMRYARIAAIFNLSERQCRKIVARQRDNMPTFEQDADEHLQDQWDLLQGAIEELAEIATTARSPYPTVKAINAKILSGESESFS